MWPKMSFNGCRSRFWLLLAALLLNAMWAWAQTRPGMYRQVSPSMLETIRKLDVDVYQRIKPVVMREDALQRLDIQQPSGLPISAINQPDSLEKKEENPGFDVLLSDRLWMRKGEFSFDFSNVGLSNWAAGGQSNISIRSSVSYVAKRETHRSTWNNSFRAQYGLARQGNIDEFRKTDDELVIESNYKVKIDENWGFSAVFNFRTQLDRGLRYTQVAGETRAETISAFLAPAFLLATAGMSYKVDADKPYELSATVSPMSTKVTYVRIDSLATQYGLVEGRNDRSEVGLNLTTSFAKEIFERVNFKNQLNLFATYARFGNIDINWETLFEMKINKFLTANFATNLIYDDDVVVERDDGTRGAAVQFKHRLDIRFVFGF